MRGRFAPYIIGAALVGLAVVTLLFSAYTLSLDEPVGGFILTTLLAGGIGVVLMRFGTALAEPTRREAIIGVLVLWIVVPLCGAVPFMTPGGFSFVDALFESMSGFTTTGATVLQDFASFPRSLFMWRALMQWIGGVGIIVLFIAVFPQLAIAGRQLFFVEVPGVSEDRFTPRLRNTASAVLLVYIVLTVACAGGYLLVDMTPFDALAHSFTTIASGGFSPNPLSFEGYASPAVEWVAIAFMLFAGANFSLQYQLVVNRSPALLRDPEFRTYLVIIVIGMVLLVLGLNRVYPVGESVRHALFQSLSIVTTTGFASVDFGLWPRQAQVVLIMLMFVGGSAGSAAGGIKVVRWLIIARSTKVELERALHPRLVSPVRLGSRAVGEEVIRAVSAFISLYFVLFAVTTAVVTWFGADFTTALTAAIACIGNIGPGLAEVGPMLNFAELHPVSRVLLTFGMYAGRLEIVTVFVVFNRDFWRLPRTSLLLRRVLPGDVHP